MIHQLKEIFICLAKEQYVFFTSADDVLAQSALTYNVSNTFSNNLFNFYLTTTNLPTSFAHMLNFISIKDVASFIFGHRGVETAETS